MKEGEEKKGKRDSEKKTGYANDRRRRRKKRGGGEEREGGSIKGDEKRL